MEIDTRPIEEAETDFFQENFCKRCMFIFRNIVKINSKNDLFENEETKYLAQENKDENTTGNPISEFMESLKSLENYSNKEDFLCKFCFGILNEKRNDEIINLIKDKIKEFAAEHFNFKLTTSFSALFLMIHTYLKLNLQKENHVGMSNYLNPGNIDYLDIGLIRKLLKPIFLPVLCESLKKESAAKASLEIRLIFEFKEDFYREVYNAFIHNSNMKGIGESRFRPNLGIKSQSYTLDRGNVNDVIKTCSTDSYYKIFGNLFKNVISLNDILEIRIDAINENILLKGNYLKFSREVGQTPWSHAGQKVCFTSVQEEMEKTLNKIFESSEAILHAGGREDRDVRMLGSGRPFIIELINPKKRLTPLQNIKEVETEINRSTHLIQVENLDACDQTYFDNIKEFEISKKKFYTCVVWTKRKVTEEDIKKLNSIKDMEIIQKTPLRVLHRRTLMDRKKTIIKLDAKLINDNFMVINVLSSAGTYIKEFIHSDLGRTNPSLPTLLGCDCDILQLDHLMESDRVKTGLYNRAKNSNNNSNFTNPVSLKHNIINKNAINFLRNNKNNNKNINAQDISAADVEENKLYNQTKFTNNENNIVNTKYNLSSSNINKSSNYNNNQQLILPEINKNTMPDSYADGKASLSKSLLNTSEKKTNNMSGNINNTNMIQNNNKNIKKRNGTINNTKVTTSYFDNDNIGNKQNSKSKPLGRHNINSTNNNCNLPKSLNTDTNLNLIKNTNKKFTVRKFKTNILKEYLLKESSIKTIQLFLDPKNQKNFILTCKKIYNNFLNNDDLWFIYYCKKFRITRSNSKYKEHTGKWREVFLSSVKKIFDSNYQQIKNKFLKNFNKNKYQTAKDPFSIPNLVYAYMKPSFNIDIDGKIFPVKHIFTNKILSHINYFINFDQEYLDYRKANKVKLYLNEPNLGLSDKIIYDIEIKKKKFLNLETEQIKSNICNIFTYNEFIFSTFEKNLIFFINISLPICKICEICFNFLNGIHSRNLLYKDDLTKDFGLHEYVLLINIKSWKEIFFSLNVNKLDFKRDKDNDEYIFYENDTRIVSNTKPSFEIKTICLEEKIENFLILDIMLLTYNGDHMICDSYPCIIKKSEIAQYEEFEYEYYSSLIRSENFILEITYKFAVDDSSLFVVDNFKLAIKTDFVSSIFKNDY